MFIQGNLQTVFDVLYALGVIDPVLKMDWSNTQNTMEHNPHKLQAVVTAVNSCSSNYQTLIQKLRNFDKESLTFLALEVAREFVDFETRHTIH